MGAGLNTGFGRLMSGFGTPTLDPMSYPEYRKYYTMAQEVCEEIRRIQGLAVGAGVGAAAAPTGYARQNAYSPDAQYARPAHSVNADWICPACNAQNSGKYCEYCGTARP